MDNLQDSVLDPEVDSDDEGAPEEVGLQAGKAAAFTEQARQSQSRQQLRATQKQRRLDQAALDQQRAEERSSKRKKLSQTTAAPDEQLPASLPDSVIEALLSNRSDPEHRQQRQEQQHQPASLQPLQTRRTKKRIVSRKAGPVIVEVLQPSKASAASEAAISFAAAKFRKHGRSSHMLLPAASQGSRSMKPATSFAGTSQA